MTLQTYKKIIFGFVLTLGLIFVPRVSFALSIYDPVHNISYNIPELDTASTYFIGFFDFNSTISTNLNGQVLYTSDSTYSWSSSSNGINESLTLSSSSPVVNLINLNSDSSLSFVSNRNSRTTTLEKVEKYIQKNLPLNLQYVSYNKEIVLDPMYYLHIIGTFSNASVNISSGSEITVNIVVTANEDYEFTSVQNGFVLSNDDTVATYDVSDLTGDFNLVATDFVTQLIGSDDPPIDPPIDPPSDDPIIIGDIDFTDPTIVGTWFSTLFSSAIDLFVKTVPFILGLFGLYFAINWLISMLKKS